MGNKLTLGLFIWATRNTTQGVPGFWLAIKQNRELIGAKAVESASPGHAWERARKARSLDSVAERNKTARIVWTGLGR